MTTSICPQHRLTRFIRCFRAFYIAISFVQQKRYKDSAALVNKAEIYMEQAKKIINDGQKPKSSDVDYQVRTEVQGSWISYSDAFLTSSSVISKRIRFHSIKTWWSEIWNPNLSEHRSGRGQCLAESGCQSIIRWRDSYTRRTERTGEKSNTLADWFPARHSVLVLFQSLIDRLETYFEDASLTNKNRLNIVSLPPPLKPIPCKPVLFDLALNHLTFPSLDEKVQSKRPTASATTDNRLGQQQQQAGLSGFVKGLFSWSGKNQ